MHIEITDTAAANIGHSEPAHPDDITGLGAARNLERLGTIQSRSLNRRAEGALAEGKRHLTVQLMPLPPQEWMILDLNHAVAVTRGATVATRFALTGQPYPHIAVDTGRNGHPPVDRHLGQALARAIRTFLSDNSAGAAAGRAGGLEPKNAGRLNNLTLPAAVVACLWSGARLGTTAVTRTALLVAAKPNCFGGAAGCLKQRQPGRTKHISTLAGTAGPTTAAENASAEQIAEGFKDVRYVIEFVLATASLQASMAIAVIAGPQIFVRKHLECPGSLLEPPGGFVISGILIRVKADGEFSISLGDLTRARPSLDPKHFIVATLVNHEVTPRRPRRDVDSTATSADETNSLRQ
jgi:hypothetical protein